MWATKIDLKHAYFHLALAQHLKDYVCIQLEDNVFQFQAACFGLSTLSHAWQSIMKVFLKKMEKARNPVLGIFRRHFTGGKFPLFSGKAVNQNAQRPKIVRL